MRVEEQRSICVNGVQLECRWFGQPSAGAPVLVLLHEGLGCVDMWRDFPQRLADKSGHAVFVYSRQGYGRSVPFSQPLGVDFMHREALKVLPRVLDEARIERAILVGHSDGASISLIYAGELQDQRVQGLVLLAPHLFVEEETLQGIREASDAYSRGTLAQGLQRYHHAHTDSTFRYWCDIWLDPAFRQWNIESSAERVSVPMLAIMGEQDQYGTVEQIERLQALVPERTVLTVLEACGHSPHLEQSESVLSAVSSFVRWMV